MRTADEPRTKGAATCAPDLFEFLRQRFGQQDVGPGAGLREQVLAQEFGNSLASTLLPR